MLFNKNAIIVNFFKQFFIIFKKIRSFSDYTIINIFIYFYEYIFLFKIFIKFNTITFLKEYYEKK